MLINYYSAAVFDRSTQNSAAVDVTVPHIRYVPVGVPVWAWLACQATLPLLPWST